MNDLSWLIYFGEISGSLSGFFLFLAILGGFGTVISYIGGVCLINDHNDGGVFLKRVALKLALPLMIFSGIVTCLLPSKETVYLIAASEAGEEVVKSPTGKKAIDAVNRYLDNVANPPPPAR